MAHALTIGQVAKATGMATKTIRYYESIGVLPPPRRTAGGYRQYDQPGVERLQFISRARALGLPLEHLKTLTRSVDAETLPALRPRLLELIREQLAGVQDQIADLQELRQQLEHIAHRLATSPPVRAAGACRCLETANGGRVQQPSRARRPRSSPGTTSDVVRR